MRLSLNAQFPGGTLAWLAVGPLLLTASLRSPAASNLATPVWRTAISHVPTRHDTVRDLLWLADVGPNVIVYDLGSGDGRIVIAAVRDFGARRAVGIELDAALVDASRANAARAGVADRVEFIHGDLFTNDFSAAHVVVVYLGHSANLDLRASLVRTLKPGTRVVSHQFGMGEWPPDKRFEVRTPVLGMYGEMGNEFKTNPDVPFFDDTRYRATHNTLFSWVVPAPVAGVWRGRVRTDFGEGELKLILHQRLSGVGGSFEFQGPTNFAGGVQTDLWGDQLRGVCMATNQNRYGEVIRFDGQVRMNRLFGGLGLGQRTNSLELTRIARQDNADFTGTWEWPGASNAPVQLKLERRNGSLAATYTDKNRTQNAWRDDAKPIPVTDLYDFEGGFYFTLLLGLEGNRLSAGSRTMGSGNGWVVGEAVLVDGMLQGTIGFHPYANPENRLSAMRAGGASNPAPARHDWQPKRVAP